MISKIVRIDSVVLASQHTEEVLADVAGLLRSDLVDSLSLFCRPSDIQPDPTKAPNLEPLRQIVRLRDHHLTIGKSATILATVEAKSIRVEGNVQGDVQASERVELAAGSSVVGDVTAPRVSIADGARFKGSVDMDKGGPRPAAASASPAVTPAAVPAGAGKAPGSTP